MSEIWEFIMGPLLTFLGFLGIVYLLLIRPAYQRMVLKIEWAEILGINELRAEVKGLQMEMEREMEDPDRGD